MTKKIAVLITVHNRKETTLACLRNLYNQRLSDDVSIEVYLTDDGCTDGTPEAVRNEFPDVHIINGDGNLFWNRGMYAAWSEAEKKDYDFYLWLNDDTFIYRSCLNKLLGESLSNNNSAIIIGATEDEAKTKTTYSGFRNGKLVSPHEANRNAGCFNGNIVLIPQGVFKVLGKNDYKFRHALGDIDYGLRASKANIPMIVCDEYCGSCELHPSIPKWKDATLSLPNRWKALYSVGGNGANPNEFFYFQRKHKGLVWAIATYISNHVHVLFPKLWNNTIG
jgi:GT2 family glycosyltransferase